MTLCSFKSKDCHIKSSNKVKATSSFPCSHVISRADLHLKKYIVVFANMRKVSIHLFAVAGCFVSQAQLLSCLYVKCGKQ